MNRKRIKVHLVCNAHLDPVWLWRWEDGLAEAVSTFRIASEFCERSRNFVFCHNEAVLYRWVEQHEPELFARIKRLVQRGRWHIAGGSYLQPDVNMPSGESQIRQFLAGKEYFRRKFGAEPSTAYNFDSFGQAEGYVQILAGCGFDSYVFCRPAKELWNLPKGAFVWRDRSGSRVLAWRANISYLTLHNAYRKLAQYLRDYPGEPEILFPWGIGNHGGGPSREDLKQIEKFAADHRRYKLVHSTPEDFFAEVKRRSGSLPEVAGEMQKIFPGCYTSMHRVKKEYRSCENLMSVTERLAALAWWTGKFQYPSSELDAAWRDLLFGGFHDILPGTCVPAAERDSLALFARCRENLRRIRTRVLIQLINREQAAGDGVTPIFVWNPHSFEAETDLECDFHHSHVPAKAGEIELLVRDAATGRKLKFQREQPDTPLNYDWRMKTVIPLKMPPFSVCRLDVAWRKRRRPAPRRMPRALPRSFIFRNPRWTAILNTSSGLLESARLPDSDSDWLRENALKPTVWEDLSDSWRCGDPARFDAKRRAALDSPPWQTRRGVFRLAGRRETAEILRPPSKSSQAHGIGAMAPVRMVEDGPVRTIIEAVFVMGRSVIIRRYVFSKTLPGLEVRDRIFWNEHDAMLKIAMPLAFNPAHTMAETPYSAVTRPIPKEHVEQVNQRWVAVSEGHGTSRYIAVLNDSSYGHSIHDNTLYLSVLRSPAYACNGLQPEVDSHKAQYWPRMDQGEHEVRFMFLLGRGFSEEAVARAADVFNAPPDWMVYFPTGNTRAERGVCGAGSLIRLSAPNVVVAALKKAEHGTGLVVRLRELAGKTTPLTISLRGARKDVRAELRPYELKTLILRGQPGRFHVQETNLIEKCFYPNFA